MFARRQLTTTCTHVTLVLIQEYRRRYCEEIISADHSARLQPWMGRRYGLLRPPPPIKVNERQEYPGSGQSHQESSLLTHDLVVIVIRELMIG
jgi:hypothetical protein